MQRKTKYKINYLLISLIIPGYYVLFNPGKIVLITVAAYLPVFFFVIKSFLHQKFKNEYLLKVILFIGMLITLRGTFHASSRAEYSSIILEIFPITLLIPILYLLGKNIVYSKYILNQLLKYSIFIIALPIFVYYYKNGNYDSSIFIRCISPLYFFIILFSKMKFINKLKISFLIIVSVLFAIDHRSNLVNIIISLLILITSYLGPRMLEHFGKKTWLILSTIPLLILYLNFKNGKFNFSNEVITDSRTSIYNDVAFAITNTSDFLFGLGSVKIETSLINSNHFNKNSIYDSGRNASESLMLNYFHWGGALMVFLFSFFVLKGVYLSIFKSRNTLSVMLAFLILFRFMYSFVEFRLGYDLSSFFYFFLIGLSYNYQLRKMNNKQINLFLKF